jgi:OmpA-OmpF porin, OOP family
MSSLIDFALRFLTPQVLARAAAALNESETAVSKGLGALIPAILAGMAGKATDDAALARMHRSLDEAASMNLLDRLGDLVGSGNLARNDPKDIAGAFIGSLFGERTGQILSAVGSFAGLKPASASSLLGLAGPLVMGAIGRRMREDDLDAGGLQRLLSAEKGAIAKALPPSLSNILGIGGVAAAVPPAAKIAAAKPAAAAGALGRFPAWAWAIPVVAVVGIGGWALTRGKGEKVVAETAAPAVIAEAPVEPSPTIDETPTAMSVTPIEPAGEFVRNLGGFELRGAPDGVESKLIAFIDSGAAPCTEAPCWFTFDRLTFKTGSAEIDMEKSAAQIENIRRILEAYPAIQLKIGGYTDNTGSDETNMALSQARAEAVVAAVAALGVDPARMDAEGYGPQHPVASNDTEEGRAQNRRIDVRVRQR